MSTDTTQRRSSYRLMLISLLAALISLTAACSEKQSSAPQSTEAPAVEEMQQEMAPAADAPAPAAEAPAPAAEAPAPAAAPDAAAAAGNDGEAVYKKACMACHAAGIANAPKLGDSAAWAPRIAKGNDALFESVKNGLNAMPPKGACMSCSDAELRSAMEYMVSQGS
jgi:cytochrome c5